MVPISIDDNLMFAFGTGIVALIVAGLFRVYIGKQPAGNDVMQGLAGQIRRGAMAFLMREYSVIGPFMLVTAVLIYFFIDTGYANIGSSWGRPLTAMSFVIGCLTSALAGFIGMRTATIANVRTAEAARSSIVKALRVSFFSGATMGLAVVGLGLIGFVGTLMFMLRTVDMYTALEALTGFSFGASCVALFARVGGGIYTKAADVGADLVGKVEAGIPEDDPRNPAVIADNVGDNVGDVAGMGADLFESYIGAMLATMLIGLVSGTEWVLYPLLVSAIGVFATILACFTVKSNSPAGVQRALKNGMIVASVLAAVATWWLTGRMFPEAAAFGIFMATMSGLVAGLLVGLITEYYTSHTYAPVRRLADSSKTGAATVLIEGLALGYASTMLPILVIVVAIGLSFFYAGMYGIAVGSVGMLMTLGMTLAIDCFGPVADNAGGIAEMSKLPKEVRETTDALDAAGNTTAAIGKGFAIGVAGFMCLALFGAFKEKSGLTSVDVTTPSTLIGLLVGGMIPFVFSALTMRAVGRAAMAIIEEVRRQFREIKGLMEGTATGDSERCVSIATAAAIQQMILPGLLAMGSPVLGGLILGKEGLGGMLAGTLVTSMLLGTAMANSGGAWDNAKKYIETGAHGGKGSDSHKAAVVGDTVGDPFKDTSGPSLNILVKLMFIMAVMTAGLYGTGIVG
ncbi:MAG: sodium-translocating pyrophosphatase [Candidatus Peribacteraceae bacterium]